MAFETKLRAFAIIVACVIAVLKVEHARASQDLLHKMTIGFTKALDQCKVELNTQENVMQDFFNFWKEDYALLNREMGCVLMCMATKLDLIGEDFKIHHGNAHDFAKAHGADDDKAKQLVTMIHECEKASAGISDDCERTLETAKCFKTKIHDLKWAPSMELILEEIMSEVKT